MIGTVVGAGIFGLPYAAAKVGWGVSLIYLLVLGLAVLVVNLCYGEVVLRTRQKYQMAGYAEKYLGLSGKTLISLSLLFGIYSGLLAYTIGVGNFLFDVLNPIFGGTALIYSLLFWLAASFAIFRGLGVVAWIELSVVIGLICLTFLLGGSSLPFINLEHLSTFNARELFFPFGIFLFALGGATAVPVMRDILGRGRNLKGLFKACLLGVLVPVIIYTIFITFVVGVSGPNTTEQAISGLAGQMGVGVLILGGLFGALAMATSFLANGFVLRELFRQDYHFPAWLSTVMACGVPLIIFLFGLRDFITVIGISGSILGGFQGILLIMMYFRAKKLGNRQPEYFLRVPAWLAGAIYIIFAFGLLYQILSLF